MQTDDLADGFHLQAWADVDTSHVLHSARFHDPHAAVLAEVLARPLAVGLDHDVPRVGVNLGSPVAAVAHHHHRLVGVVGLADRIMQGLRIVEHPQEIAAGIQTLVRPGEDPQSGIQSGQVFIGAAGAELCGQRVAMQFGAWNLFCESISAEFPISSKVTC